MISLQVIIYVKKLTTKEYFIVIIIDGWTVFDYRILTTALNKETPTKKTGFYMCYYL